jgi:predicted nuclease of restriction endonuclease-like (RecB) superfamily
MLLAKDLHDAFPDTRSFSPRNLKYMRAFAAAWPERAIVQEPLAQITWYHNIALLEKLTETDDRLWYARQALKNGWSHNILVLQIDGRAHERQGKALTNFSTTLPPAESDMASQVFKDPYLFDFLGTADPRREREVEQALVDHIQRFLLELGTGFAFVCCHASLLTALYRERLLQGRGVKRVWRHTRHGNAQLGGLR